MQNVIILYTYVLLGRRGCTHPTSGLSDTALHVPESDPFKHRVRTEGNALGQITVLPPTIALNANVLSFLCLFCFSLLKFFSSSSGPNHMMVPKCGEIMLLHSSLYRPLHLKSADECRDICFQLSSLF